MVRQWTIKGISSESVELARTAAKTAGMRQGPWLENIITAAAVTDEARIEAMLNRLARIQVKAYRALLNAGMSEDQASKLASDSSHLYALLSTTGK